MTKLQDDVIIVLHSKLIEIMSLIERQFVKALLGVNPEILSQPNVQPNDVKWGTRIKFNDATGIRTRDDLARVLEKLGISNLTPKVLSGAPKYADRGFLVEWNNYSIQILLNSSNQEQGFYPRKTFSPEKLNLDGYKTTTNNPAKEIADRAIDSINQSAIINDLHKPIITEIINSVLEQRTFAESKWLNESGELSKIESDLGETLAAIYSALQGNQISFPDTSNNKFADFIENTTLVSVKSPKGGSVNLSDFADILPNKTPVERVFWSCGNHDKEELFAAAAVGKGIIQDLSNLVGGTTIASVQKFVNATEYDTFYNWIKSHKENPTLLGLPDEGVPRTIWANGNLDPFYFTLCTLINRIWAENNQPEISNVLKSILTGPKFLDVCIDVNKKCVIITEQHFDDVENWTMHYWSRATKAFHNWPAARRIKEKK